MRPQTAVEVIWKRLAGGMQVQPLINDRGEAVAEAAIHCPECNIYGEVHAAYNPAWGTLDVSIWAENAHGGTVLPADALARCEQVRAACDAIRAAKEQIMECWHQHREQQRQQAEEYAAAQRALLAECQERGKRTFVRFGKPPAGGRSRDYRDNVLLPGVSCYAAWRLADGRYVLDLRYVDRASALFIVGVRAPYELWGRVVGLGSDGEPLLRVRRAVRIPPEAKMELLQLDIH